jgi:hypothetical protein
LIYTDSHYVIADTEAELAQMSAILNLPIKQQGNKYGIITLPSRRHYQLAMDYDAIPITPRELAAMADNRLHTGTLGDPDTAPAIMTLRREGE